MPDPFEPAPYLTVEDLLAARPRLGDEDPALLPARVRQFEEIAERARGVAYTPRQAKVTRSRWAARTRRRQVRLGHVAVRSIDSVSMAGVPVADPSAGAVTPTPLGDLLAMAGSWSVAPPIEVVYMHGLDAPEACIIDACAEYVEAVTDARLSGVSRNVLSQVVDGATTRYSTPDWPAGRFTGWLEVDRLINSARDYRPVGLA